MKYAAMYVLIFFVLNAISCGGQPVSNAPQGQIAIEHDGATVFVPATITFHGDDWTFSEPAPFAITRATHCTYQSNTYSNESLDLVLGKANSEIEWSLTQYRVNDSNSGRQMTRELYRSRNGFAYLDDYALGESLNSLGERIGPRKEFYANGQVKSIGCWDGLRHGEYRAYYPNGHLWWEGAYRDSLFLDDGAVFYNEDGSINEDVNTVDESAEELDQWKHCQSEESCDSIVEFLRKVEESRNSN